MEPADHRQRNEELGLHRLDKVVTPSGRVGLVECEVSGEDGVGYLVMVGRDYMFFLPEELELHAKRKV
jgi:hypothetical protein